MSNTIPKESPAGSRKRGICDEIDDTIVEGLHRSSLNKKSANLSSKEDAATSTIDNMQPKIPLKRQNQRPDDHPEEETLGITRLSLEAIFHPKFENENRQLLSIRKNMTDKVSRQQGYLEVSLKHSGNLLLWSGGQRFFSKNSTSNAFTFVGEVLLRQHFHRSWYSEESRTTSASPMGDIMYCECSNYVENHRLTLAFESVTSFLGHHGDLPKKDFLILTAVAERSVPRFYSTFEILKFAQRFRLPHNDVWVCSTLASVDKLFHLYDSTRETGLAEDTVTALSSFANAHVSSMYPHVDFQGPILEGIVIRYVSYMHGEKEQQENQLRGLEHNSLDILEKVPVSRPMGFELYSNNKIMSLDIRQVFRDCIARKGFENDLTNRLGDAINQVFNDSDVHRRKTKKEPIKDWDIPRLAKSVLEKPDIDTETRQIAEVIIKLDEQRATVRYGVFREDGKRLLCTVHVLHDKAFMKFQKQMRPGDMHLFRGFSFELLSDDKVSMDQTPFHIESTIFTEDSSDTPTMLKMKFLPYMVRTFCCRNGLHILANEGPTGFVRFTCKQMSSWDISEEAKTKWQPFFHAWGKYAYEAMNNVRRDYIDKSLPPMSEEFYLSHLEHFVPLYESGKIQLIDEQEETSALFRGLVMVVAVEAATALQVAKFVAQELGGALIYKASKETSQGSLRISKSCCRIVSATLEDRKYQQKQLRGNDSDLYIILVGCDAQSIADISSHSPPSKAKLLKEYVYALQKTRNVTMVAHIAPCTARQLSASRADPDLPVHFEASEELVQLVAHFQGLSDAKPLIHFRRGLLVFFPGIPGCGKSALSGAGSQRILADFLKACPSDEARDLVVLVGDQVKKKYWRLVANKISEKPASLVIADKNVPRNTWPIVGTSAGNAVVMPVIPDNKALCTTRIAGTLNSSGKLDDSVSHYYPFSLHYLAVCMARVMARPANSHIGGLDCALNKSCMVVIMFFGFYRNVFSDDFVDSIQSMISKKGSVCASRPIELPFFRSGDIPDLPEDLLNTLIEAVQLQYGCELERIDPTESVEKIPLLQDIERRLRYVISKHETLLFEMTASEAETRCAFVDQVIAQIKSLSIADISTIQKIPPIELVAIDVCVESLHNELNATADKDIFLSSALSSLGIDFLLNHHDEALGTSQDVDGRSCLQRETHITMAHGSQMSQEEMRSRFEPLLGKTVDICVTGMLWSTRIAALSVSVPATTVDGCCVPASLNEFVHITFWRTMGTHAVEANKLPALVASGLANTVAFKDPFVIKGILSFWT